MPARSRGEGWWGPVTCGLCFEPSSIDCPLTLSYPSPRVATGRKKKGGLKSKRVSHANRACRLAPLASSRRGASSQNACSAATGSANSYGRPCARRRSPAARVCRNPRQSDLRARRGPRPPPHRRGQESARSRPGPRRRGRERHAVDATFPTGAAPKARPHASANPLFNNVLPQVSAPHTPSMQQPSALGELWKQTMAKRWLNRVVC